MNAAQLMIQCLEEEKVKYIFGVPGEENEDFLFALENSDIIFIPTRHEQGAAFMADVWGRLTGKAGVCLATLGPGATNLITAIADAYLDRAPLVAITGQGSTNRLHRESHQIIDVTKMLNPITKWNAHIQDVEVIPEIVRKAFKVAEAEKPGATHIEFPENIASRQLNESIPVLKNYSVRRPAPDSQAISLAIQLLKQSKKPLIIAGNGVIRTEASEALTEFSTQFQIPVSCTFMGKGAISDRHPLSLGSIGLGFKDYVIEATEAADLIICIGFDIVEHDPAIWNPQGKKRIIHIDLESAEVDLHYNPEIEVLGDLTTTLQEITNGMQGITPYLDFTLSTRSLISKSIQSFTLDDDSTEFNAPGVINAIRDILPDNGLLISDVGSHKMWIARNFKTYIPNGCIISNGLATMGIALPGGIAANLVDSHRPVVCLMGDGGAMMNIQELETAKRLGISCTFIILNDNNYGLITWKQEMSEDKSFGTKLGNPNFVQLAESFGIDGYKPKNIADFKNILANSISGNKLSVIEVPISTEVNETLTDTLSQYFDSKKSK